MILGTIKKLMSNVFKSKILLNNDKVVAGIIYTVYNILSIDMSAWSKSTAVNRG